MKHLSRTWIVILLAGSVVFAQTSGTGDKKIAPKGNSASSGGERPQETATKNPSNHGKGHKGGKKGHKGGKTGSTNEPVKRSWK